MSMDLSQIDGIVRAEDACSMSHPVHGYGGVVAFEGRDLISTQLRLLPISSKILILNSLLDAIPRFAAGSRFDAPSFVAHVHKVFAARAATARSFLEDSTEEHPRLVLMNGGSMSAKAVCLEKICEKVTSGDLVKAEAVYEDIVKSCGLDNMVPAFISAYPELILSRQTSPVTSEFADQPSRFTAIKSDEEYAQAARNFIRNKEDEAREEIKTSEISYQKDPGFVAMRAASLLDRAAISVHSRQNSEYRFARTDTVTTRTSMDTSVWGLSRAGTLRTVSDGPSDMSSLMSRGRTLVRGTLRDRRMGRQRFSSLDSNLLLVDLGNGGLDASHSSSSPCHVLPRHQPLSPLSANSPQKWTRYSEATTVASFKELSSLLRSGSNRDTKSIPPTPIIFEFGEARLISVASTRNLKRTSSVDGMFPIPEQSSSTNLARSSVLKHSYSTMCLSEEPTTSARLSRPPPPLPALLPSNQPRKVTVKASKRSLDNLIETPLLEPHNNKASMVDRGCSPMRFNPASIEEQAASSIPSMPTSPTDENLINDVDDEHRNKIFEAIMNGYRNNTNQLTEHSYSKLDSDEPSSNTVFNRSTLVTRPPNPVLVPIISTITTDCRYSELKPRPTIAPYDVQPLRKDSVVTMASMSEKDYSRITANATPPTPASTPPPVTPRTHQFRKLSDFGIIPATPSAMPAGGTEQGRKLSDFGIIADPPSSLPSDDTKVTQLAMLENFGIINNKPIETQNSLRSTLGKHFLSKHGYNQYPIKTDVPEKLWKPVFQESDDTLVGSIPCRTMDQILALGCDDFIERGVWTNVLARVESLGMLKDGSAVGKLDMQYLMTTAMETFTTLPPSHHTNHSSNPFTSPTQLAKLFIPHLERYLSSNPSVRFLIITFPSASLSSMIALRNLLGNEAMKVAMLSNPRSSTPTLQPVRSSQAINKLSNDATIALNSRKRVPLSRLGNSKAQALLGNEQVPKPIGLKKSANGLMQMSRSSLEDQAAQDKPDFTLEITSMQDSEIVERAVDELVHKVRKVLIEKNSIYGSAVPPSPHFAIANWSAATSLGGRNSPAHSPTSSTSSRGSKFGLSRKLTKDTIESGISPATSGRSRGHELMSSLSRTFSQRQRIPPAHLNRRGSDNKANRESGDWQKMYLSIGEDIEDLSVQRPLSPTSRPAPSQAPSQQPSHFTARPTTTSPENDRSESRATTTSHLDLDSDSEEEEEEVDTGDDGQLFLPRQGQGNGNRQMRGGLPVRRDIGKALRMLGIT